MIGALAEPAGHAPAKPRIRSSESAPPASQPAVAAPGDAVTSTVLSALVQRGGLRRGRERRNERRYPYPHPVFLTPLDDCGPRVEETVQVFGKNLSEHGLDFYHCEPLPHRRVIASLKTDSGWVGLVLDLKWCRFTSDGLYDNGGRFVATVPSPLQDNS